MQRCAPVQRSARVSLGAVMAKKSLGGLRSAAVVATKRHGVSVDLGDFDTDMEL